MDGKNLYRLIEGAGKHALRTPEGVVMLHAGDSFRAYPYQVQSIIDKLEIVEDLSVPAGLSLPRVVPRGRGWFNVINSATGLPINDKALRFDEAVAMRGAPVECSICQVAMAKPDPRILSSCVCESCASTMVAP